MADSCGIDNIKIGKVRVPSQDVEAAILAGTKEDIFELKVAAGWQHIKKLHPALAEDMGIKAWRDYLERRLDVGKKRKVTTKDITSEDSPNVQTLKELLNLSFYSYKDGQEVKYSVDEDTENLVRKLRAGIIANPRNMSEERINVLIKNLQLKIKEAALRRQSQELRKQAKTNIRTKLGAARDVFPLLQMFTNINPAYVPTKLISKYMSALTALGQRGAVLEVKEWGKLMEDVKDVLDGVKSYEVRLGSVKVSDERKDALIDEILSENIDVKALEQRDERDDLRELLKLNREDLQVLDGQTLNKLVRALRGVKNGLMHPVIKDALMTVVAHKAKTIPAVGALKTLYQSKILAKGRLIASLKSIAKGNSSEMLELLRAHPKFSIDVLIGNTKDKTFAEQFINPLAAANQRAETEGKGLDAQEEKLQLALQKEKKTFREEKKGLRKVSLLLKAEDFASNQGVQGVFSARDLALARIQSANNFDGLVTQEESELMDELLKEFDKGGTDLDIAALKKSLSPAEKKIYGFYRETMSKAANQMAYTSGVVKGERADVRANYSPDTIIDKDGVDEDLEFMKSQFVDKEAKEQKRLDKGKPPVVHLDPLYDATKYGKSASLQYHLLPVIKETRRSFDMIEKQLREDGATQEQKEIFQAVRKLINHSIDSRIMSQYAKPDKSEKAIKNLVSTGYVVQLASVPRFVAEFVSNMSYVAIAGFDQWQKGREANLSNDQLGSVLYNMGSIQQDKIMGDGMFNNQRIEKSFLKTGKKLEQVGGFQQERMKKAGRLFRNNKAAQFSRKAGEFLLGFSDRFSIRDAWVGFAAESFQKETGKKINWKKIQDNDEQYMSENKEAIEKAKNAADAWTAEAGSSTDHFTGISKFQKEHGDTAAKNVYKAISSHLMKFMSNEASSATKFLIHAVNGGHMSKTEAMRGMAALTVRMAIYMPVIRLLGAMLEMLVGGEPDEEEFDLAGNIMTETYTSLISLGTGGTLGSPTRTFGAYIIEQANKAWGEGITRKEGEEYNSWKHSLVYSSISDRDIARGSVYEILGKTFGGPARPLMKSLQQSLKDYQALSRANPKNESYRRRVFVTRLVLNAMAHSGMNPVHRDVNKILTDYLKTIDK